MSVPEPLHPIEYEIGRGVGHLVDDFAVGEKDDSVGIARSIGVMGDHDDRLPEFTDGTSHELQDLGARTAQPLQRGTQERRPLVAAVRHSIRWGGASSDPADRRCR